MRTFRIFYQRILNGFRRKNPTSVHTLVRREISLEQEENREHLYETISWEFVDRRHADNTTELIDFCMTRMIIRSAPQITWKYSWSTTETRDALLTSPFSSIPTEIYLQIFRFLSIHDLGNVSLVCRQFKIIVDDDEIWKSKCNTSNKLISKSFKEIFMDWTYEKYLREQEWEEIEGEDADMRSVEELDVLRKTNCYGPHRSVHDEEKQHITLSQFDERIE